MHKKCNKFLDGELNEFKKSLKQKLVELGIVNVGNNKTVTNEDEETKKMLKISKELLKFINDFKPKQFAAEDFKKRKRVKNIVPVQERCMALRSDKQQCTRRKRNGHEFCGTHIKGIPHGKKNNTHKVVNEKTIALKTQDIMGIIYYIDERENVYNPRDIMNNKKNPQIIAKYTKKGDKYSIKNFI